MVNLITVEEWLESTTFHELKDEERNSVKLSFPLKCLVRFFSWTFLFYTEVIKSLDLFDVISLEGQGNANSNRLHVSEVQRRKKNEKRSFLNFSFSHRSHRMAVNVDTCESKSRKFEFELIVYHIPRVWRRRESVKNKSENLFGFLKMSWIFPLDT